MKKAANDVKKSIDLLNEFYATARARFAPGTPGRLAIVGKLNEIHDEICDGKQAHCARCAEFGEGGGR